MVIVTKIIPVFGIIAVFLKVCSICSESTDRPTQTEIVLKSVTVFIILYLFIYYIIKSATVKTKLMLSDV